MKLSLNWLNSLVDISDLSTEEIEERAVKAGFEIEEKIKIGSGTNLVAGKVIECHNHPDSDHLHITKVDVGNEVLDIVCGAPNCREGIKVIVARVGAVLPGGEIKAGVIRGVASNGMLCSLQELGVDKDMLKDDSCSHDGIEELDDSFNVGDTDILKKLGYDDTVLDLGIYANIPDCLAMHYMAKEMAAILRRPCHLPDFDGASDIGEKSNFRLSSESENCPHFLVKVCNSVTIKPSPAWMQEHLRANGIKCINNLVDISNYVMLETGQPMHFYDLRSNPNKNITVKDNLNCDYEALDENIYHIEPGDIMITSDNEPIGIGGIMGGEGSKIQDDTTAIIIESALFDHAQIRRTANRLGLQTEAAARYSKGLEPLSQKKAMDRAVQLLTELADATDFEETVECGSDNYTPVSVTETLSHLNALIGKEYKLEEVKEVLEALDFRPEFDGDSFVCHIPSYRTDISIREDIDEEICRLTDFDDLKSSLPLMPQTVGKLSCAQSNRRTIKNFLINKGLNEVITYSLVSKKYIEDSVLNNGDAIELLSPLSEDRRYVRTSLLNSLLEVLSYNLGHYNSNVNNFEISDVYYNDHQESRLGVILDGNLLESKVKHITLKNDFYTLKGLIVSLFDRLGFEMGRVSVEVNEIDTVHFHPGISALVKMNGRVIGIIGKLHPAYATKFKLKDVYAAEIILDEINNSKPARTKAPEINKYPSISRDISIVVKDEVEAYDLIRTAKKAGGKLVKSVEIFDIYKGEHIEEGYKSVSLNIVYESKEKTLKVDDINEPHNKIMNELNKAYNANLRG